MVSQSDLLPMMTATRGALASGIRWRPNDAARYAVSQALSGAGPICFARSTQPAPRGRVAQLELPRSRSPATLNVHPRTLGKAGSLGPRLARNLAQRLTRR